MVSSYVLVSTTLTDKAIYAGPILWDGATALAVPAGQQAVLESAALAQGYAYPAASTQAVNATTLRQRAGAALNSNVTYLALTAPTNAQVVAQVNLLTREASAIIRLLLDLTDTTSGS